MISSFHLMKIRNFIVSNFFVNINSIIINNNKYIYVDNDIILFYILKLIPFCFFKIISNYFDIKFIYSYDNLYYITNIKQNYILPVILQLEFVNDKNTLNLKDELLSYNSNIPITYIINKYNLHNYDKIIIKYLNDNKITSNTLNINECKYKKIYDFFYNCNN